MTFMASMTCALLAALSTAPDTDGAGTSPSSYQEDGKQIFLPGYFDRYAPQTALDMVGNLPGFQIKEAETRRGLGQGGTNVLINGARVSGKSQDPLDLLSRTSKDAVVRIEIVDGASLGISGLSGPVANVVTNTTKRTGNFEWNPQFRKGLATRLTNGSVSVTGSMGDLSYTLGFENDSFRNGAWGTEFITGPDGEILETRYETVQPYGENPSVSLNLSHKDAAGREANFNASYTLFEFDFGEISERDPIDPSVLDSIVKFDEGEGEWNTEVSGDYAFDAFGGRLKLIGFQYYEHSEFNNHFHAENGDGFIAAEMVDFTVDEGESILRAEQTWTLGEGRSFELGTEGVYNFNDRETALFEIDEDGGATPVEIAGANTKIEERRGEVSATYNFPLGEKLDVQSSLAFEYSELEQSGDLGNKRSFNRPKGFVSATYALTPTLELRGRVEREVGQLDFFAFASSIDLDQNNDRQGNSELVPEQSWNYEVELEKNFADDSQMTLRFRYFDIEDVVQTVPITLTDPMTGMPVEKDGIGNIPEAKQWSVKLTGTQMLDRFGLAGGQVDYDILYRESEIEDPYSGEIRRLNGQTKWYYDFEFRHDIPGTNWAWGGQIEDFFDSKSYRRTGIGSGADFRLGYQAYLYDQSKPTTELFVEHKDVFGFNVTAYVFNVLDYTEDNQREVFDGNSEDAPLVFKEFKAQDFDPIFGLNIERTF